MKHQVCSIRDQAVDAFGQPFYTPTTGAAIRAFGDALKDESQMMAKHPEDFALFHLGEYDDATGKHENLEAPKQLILGKQLKGA